MYHQWLKHYLEHSVSSINICWRKKDTLRWTDLLVNVFSPALPAFIKVNFLSQDTEIWKEHMVPEIISWFPFFSPVHMTSPLTLKDPSKKLPSAHSFQIHHHHATLFLASRFMSGSTLYVTAASFLIQSIWMLTNSRKISLWEIKNHLFP